MYQIILHSKAEKEIAESVQWYAERSNNAYQRFLKEVDTGIELLKKNPKSFPVVYANKRKLSLQRFPYSIIYIINSKEVIILSVFHHSRNPGIWKNR